MLELLMGIFLGIGLTLCAMRVIENRREKKFLREHNVNEECIEVI